MKVLVTGGAGFIGVNLCRRLLQEPGVHEVRVIDDFSTGSREALAGVPVRIEEASILDRTALRRAAGGCDAIVHLAALGSVPRSVEAPLRSHAVNATGSLEVLEAARANKNAHVILASSSSVYGANAAIPKSEDLQCQPMSPYAVSKLAAEQYAMAYAQCYALPVLPFRFFNVFGPGQLPGHAYAAVVPVFLEAALNGKPLPLNGDGEQSRDFTFVETVTEAIVLALKSRIASPPMNLAFGTRTTLNELVENIQTISPHSLSVVHREARAGDVRHSQADNSQLRRAFPTLDPVSLLDGLRSTYDWMQGHLANTVSMTSRGV